MEQILKELDFDIAYIDDVLVHSLDHDSHLIHLETVFSRLRDAKLKLKIKKCHFGCIETKSLGYIVSAACIRINESKLSAMRDYPIPKSAKQARKFNEFTSCYRNFIPNYVNINEPIHKAALLTTLDSKSKTGLKRTSNGQMYVKKLSIRSNHV